MPAAGAIPPRPALIRDDADGAAIEVEVWELEPAAFGDFVSKIPGPLGIGKVSAGKRRRGSRVYRGAAGDRRRGGNHSFGGWKAWLVREE